MSLTETIKELKGQLEEETKKESEEQEADDAVEETPEADLPTEKPPEPEKPKEEPKQDVKEDEPDASAYQRMRREKAAADKLVAARDAELTELRAKMAAPKEETETTPMAEISPEVQEMLHDHRTVRAEREFKVLEDKFASTTPDYHNVSNEYALALAQSIKIQNPRMSNLEIAERTKDAILRKASGYVNNGFDPIEELYQEAKELGFTGKSFKKADETKDAPKEEDIKPDMKKVAANRAKSTGMTGTSGESKGQLTKQAANELTVAEWSKLPAAEKRRLMYG